MTDDCRRDCADHLDGTVGERWCQSERSTPRLETVALKRLWWLLTAVICVACNHPPQAGPSAATAETQPPETPAADSSARRADVPLAESTEPSSQPGSQPSTPPPPNDPPPPPVEKPEGWDGPEKPDDPDGARDCHEDARSRYKTCISGCRNRPEPQACREKCQEKLKKEQEGC